MKGLTLNVCLFAVSLLTATAGAFAFKFCQQFCFVTSWAVTTNLKLILAIEFTVPYHARWPRSPNPKFASHLFSQSPGNHRHDWLSDRWDTGQIDDWTIWLYHNQKKSSSTRKLAKASTIFTCAHDAFLTVPVHIIYCAISLHWL